jgi:xanthine/uracil permease
VPRLFVLGLRHLFIMYAGAVAVPLIAGGALGLPASTIGLLVNADLLVSGIATVIQSAGIGKVSHIALAGLVSCSSWSSPGCSAASSARSRC